MTSSGQAGHVEVGAATLRFTTVGEGTPVVLVHAGIADRRMWAELVPLLSADHRVVSYDLRGYGESPLPAGAFSHVDDLVAVLTQVVGGPAHLVGASMGGRVALDLALDRPDLVRGLVLLGAAVSGFEPDVDEPPLWDEMVAAHHADDVDALADLEARLWLADHSGERLRPGLLDLVREMNRTALVNERSGVAAETAVETVAAERLDRLAVPTLVVVGTLDQPDIRFAAELVASSAPDARLVELSGVAHLPALEVPETVAALVRESVRAAAV